MDILIEQQISRGNSKSDVIKHEELLFYYLKSYGTSKIETLIGYDAIILEASDTVYTHYIIKKFRGSHNPEFYLKPIFLISNSKTKDPVITNLNDGTIISLQQLPEIGNTVRQQFLRSIHLDHSHTGSHEMFLLKKALNYLYTRQLDVLTPVIDPHTSFGYNYPILNVNFDSFEEIKVLEILEIAEKEGLFRSDFEDKIYLCNSCNSGYLLYREICPKCNSSNLETEDLIHHFPCSYIGPASDYKNKVDSAYTCPKCSKNLHHIGVDYDKPSVIYHCGSCNNHFQDYVVKAKCVCCTNDSEVQFLIPKNINNYRLTKKGMNGALSNVIGGNEKIFLEIEGVLSTQTFTTLVHYGLERMKVNPKLSASIVIIYFENIFEVIKKVGNLKVKTLLTEITQIIRKHIHSSDTICLRDPSLIYLCINDQPHQQVESLMMQLLCTIQELLKNNFSPFNLKIKYQITVLRKDKGFEGQLSDATKKLLE